jgi:hypothetical protein
MIQLTNNISIVDFNLPFTTRATTNMPPWKNSLTESEICQVVFYIQGFATPQDYNAKWGPQYSDPYARNLKIIQSSIGTTPVAASIILAAIVLRAALSLN